MAIYGKRVDISGLAVNGKKFEIAGSYLEKCVKAGSEENRRILSLSDGQTSRVELSDGVFAIEQSYTTKPRSEKRFESHRKYIDAQCVVDGAESMECAAVDTLAVAVPYDDADDIIWYEGGSGTLRRVTAGEYAVFYPADAHIPGLSEKIPERVFKTVVKIPAI